MNEYIQPDQLTDKDKAWRRFSDLMDERKTKYDPVYKEIRQFIHPARGEFDDETANDGKRKDKHLIDQRARRDSKVLGAGMQGGLTPITQEWINLTFPDKELSDYKPVREYLDEIKSRVYKVLAKSNFYSCIQSSYEELGIFSTSPLLILEDDQAVIRCRSFTVGEYAIAQDAKQTINTFSRYLKMTAPQMVEQFGRDNVSRRVREMYERGNYKDYINVMHLIEPNLYAKRGKVDAANMPFRSLYWEEGCDSKNKFLRVSGFQEFPAPTARWGIIGSRTYGDDGPGHCALGESKSLQVMQKDSLIACELGIKPPMLVPDIMPVNMFPGGLTPYAAGQDAQIKPLFQAQSNIKDTEYKISRLQEILDTCFYYDLFLLTASNDKTMTAYEVNVRESEKMTVLGPVINNVTTGQLKPAVERVLAIMERRGLLPEPPPEIVGMEYEIEFVSIFAQALRQLNIINSIQEVVAFASSVATVKPEVLDVVDFEEAVNEFALAKRAPSTIIRSDQQIDVIREQRQQKEQQAQMVEMAAMAAQGAKTLSDTNTSQKNGLTDMLGIPL